MNETRFSGMWCCAQQGSGKTFALARMIAKDVEEENSVIVLDSKGDLTGEVRKWALDQTLVVLDPEEPFAICPFDVPKTNISLAADQILYLFSALVDTALTPMQQSFMRPVIRALIIGHPQPTFETFHEVIYEGMPNKVLENIPPDLKRFFDREWESYARTRGEIKWRLQLLLENDLFRTMFSATKTKYDIAWAMDNGICTVVDNSQAKLGVYGSAFLGRWFLSRVWAAATQRHLIPEEDRHPVCVYVDECHTLLDTTCAKIIDECRSAKIALVLSHQRSSQIPDPNVRGALENCAIKMVNVAHGEIDYFSKLLDIPAERMKDLPRGHFAMNVRWEGPSIQKVDDDPMSIPFNYMRPRQEAELRARMKKHYGIDTLTAAVKGAAPEASKPVITHGVSISAPSAAPRAPSHDSLTSQPIAPENLEDNRPSTWKRG